MAGGRINFHLRGGDLLVLVHSSRYVLHGEVLPLSAGECHHTDCSVSAVPVAGADVAGTQEGDGGHQVMRGGSWDVFSGPGVLYR